MEETTAQLKFRLSFFMNWLFQDMEIHIRNDSVLRISSEGLQLPGCWTKHLGNIHLCYGGKCWSFFFFFFLSILFFRSTEQAKELQRLRKEHMFEWLGQHHTTLSSSNLPSPLSSTSVIGTCPVLLSSTSPDCDFSNVSNHKISAVRL